MGLHQPLVLTMAMGPSTFPDHPLFEHHHEFHEGAQSTGQHDGGVAEFDEFHPPFLHGLEDDEFVGIRVSLLDFVEEARGDSDGVATTGPDRVGGGAHEADVSAAVDEADSFAGHPRTKGGGDLEVRRVDAI